MFSIQQAEKKVKIPQEPRIAVGFGACQDIYADGMEVLAGVGAAPPEIPEHVSEIHSLEDLEKIFTYFFEHGAAAECVLLLLMMLLSR